jgi:hypothetical protein
LAGSAVAVFAAAAVAAVAAGSRLAHADEPPAPPPPIAPPPPAITPPPPAITPPPPIAPLLAAEASPPVARPPLWPTVAAATALAALAGGGALFAEDDRHDLQRRGVYLMAAGFAAAPWIAHAGAHRPRRALAFGLVALATSAATVVAGHADPFDTTLSTRQRVPFEILFSSAFAACVAGVVDGYLVAPGRDDRP